MLVNGRFTTSLILFQFSLRQVSDTILRSSSPDVSLKRANKQAAILCLAIYPVGIEQRTGARVERDILEFLTLMDRTFTVSFPKYHSTTPAEVQDRADPRDTASPTLLPRRV